MGSMKCASSIFQTGSPLIAVGLSTTGAGLGAGANWNFQRNLRVLGKAFRSRGYKLRVEIMAFPGGMPGDIGMRLVW
jgi:hypothetical protein